MSILGIGTTLIVVVFWLQFELLIRAFDFSGVSVPFMGNQTVHNGEESSLGVQ